jgi:hypothetical protein
MRIHMKHGLFVPLARSIAARFYYEPARTY